MPMSALCCRLYCPPPPPVSHNPATKQRAMSVTPVTGSWSLFSRRRVGELPGMISDVIAAALHGTSRRTRAQCQNFTSSPAVANSEHVRPGCTGVGWQQTTHYINTRSAVNGIIRHRSRLNVGGQCSIPIFTRN